MHPFHTKMMCQMCPDKKRIKSALNDATSIYQRMQQLLDRNYPSPGEIKKHRSLFDSHMSCRFTGNSCSEFSKSIRELHLIEEQLETCYHRIIKSFENLDVGRVEILKHRLFELCRGHYPKAASFIQRSYP
jgi:hypothetical protein